MNEEEDEKPKGKIINNLKQRQSNENEENLVWG